MKAVTASLSACPPACTPSPGEDAANAAHAGEEDGAAHGGGAGAASAGTGGGRGVRGRGLVGGGAAGGAWLCCVPCAWLRGHAALHRAALTAATLLVTALLVASPVIFLISSKPGERRWTCDPRDDDECGPTDCTSRECQMVAARLLSAINLKADPCIDFFKFACDGSFPTHAGKWEAGPHGARKWGLQWTGDALGEGAATSPSSSTPSSTHRGSGTASTSATDVPFVSFPVLQPSVDRHIQDLLESAVGGRFDKLGVFYNSCLKAGDKRISYAPLFALLDELGGHQAMNSTPDLTTLMANLLAISGSPLFSISVNMDMLNRTGHAIYLDLPSYTSPYFSFHSVQEPPDPLVPAFHDLYAAHRGPFMPEDKMADWRRRRRRKETSDSRQQSSPYAFLSKKIQARRLVRLEKLLREFLPPDIALEQRSKESHSILLIVSKITEALPPMRSLLHRMSDVDTAFNSRMRVSKLQRDFPFVEWKRLFTLVFNTSISDDQLVYVFSTAYLDALQSLIPKFPPSVVHNALLLVFATDNLLELVDVKASSDWAATCGRVTTQVFAQPVAALYLSQWSQQELSVIKHRVSGLLELLRATAAARMQSLPWLDQATRNAALRKLVTIEGRLIAPPQLFNETIIEALLKNVEVDSEDFFGNVLRRFRQVKGVSVDLESPPPKVVWTYPYVANAFYDQTLNTVEVPLATVAQPWLWGAVPRYVWLASLGTMLAHEMLHGFDLNGVRMRADGTIGLWMTSETRLKMEARVHCLARQYARTFSRSVRFMGHNFQIEFDWNLTRNENLADVGGLQLAWEAWRGLQEDGLGRPDPDPALPGVPLSPKQLFFVAAAQNYCYDTSPIYYLTAVEVDTHTPYRERVNGMMMNSEGFAEAFKCPYGTPLNKGNKCSIW